MRITLPVLPWAGRLRWTTSFMIGIGLVCLIPVISILSSPANDALFKPIITQYTGGGVTVLQPPKGPWEKIQDDVVIIIKTGLEVADTRMPHIERYGMLNTPGRVIPNIVKVATDPHEELGVYGIRELAMKMAQNASTETKDKLFAKKGWAGDVYKNFPALKIAHNFYPNKTMYIHADDDTFFILDALADHIDRFRQYKAEGVGIIEGRTFTAAGCRLPDDHFKGTSFAHGGSGIFLSEPAMRVLSENIEECFDRYVGCWAGDASIAFCAQHNHMTVKSFPVKLGLAGMVKHFFPMAPGLEARGDERPVTFHKIAPIEQAALSDLVNLRLEKNLGPANYTEIRDHLEHLRLTNPIDVKPVGPIKGDPRNPKG